MKKNLKDRFAAFLCFIATIEYASAQVVVDNSFGNAGALSGPNFKIPDTLGKAVGDNLFHSFSEFSLQTGQAATFTGPDSIQNILGRVTGDKVSEIDGLIRSEITDANLYLLNPNGFLFGKNAKVDVDGSFKLSTRESLKLGEDGQFNAVKPDRSVFTSAAPNAFGFLGANPGGTIKFSGTKLIVKNPVGLVGGDIRLDDAVIYSKSEGKPTGVSIEASNLSIVDSQIRNKSKVEVEGVQQGIAIELSGDLEITDTTITEADGSGVDRGDFIDEIGSDVPFASRVGLLGITEGFENPDPIAIKAKDATITGGGAYSVNVVTEGERSAAVEASRIDMSTETLQMEQATLEVTTKMDGVEEVEITQRTTLTESANSVTLRRPIFAQEGSVDVFLNGKRQREGRDYTLRFNQSGALEQVAFEEAILEGAELEFVMQQNLTRSNLVVANTSGEVSLVKNSKVKAGNVEMDVNRLSIDESHVTGSGLVDIHAETVLKLDNESSVKANLLEQGSVQLTSGSILIDDQSLLAGSSRVALTADSNVEINGESQVRVGWADARGPRQGSVKDILWDSNNGKVVDQNGLSPRGRFKDEASVIRKITSQYGSQGTINVIDINQPIDHAAVPHVSIKSGGISVKNGSFTGDSGGIKSAIMMQSEKGIRISGDSAFRQFDQVALNAKSVEVLSGIDIESKSNRQDVYTGFFVVNSKEAATLSGGRLFGSLVVNAGTDISVTDMELGYGETKLGSEVFKLNADGDIYLGSGELGVTGTAHSKMLNIEGRDVHIKGYGLMSQSGMGIIGLNRVEVEGPAGIKTNAVGSQELVVKAPDVTLSEGVTVFAQLLPQEGLNVTGKVRISGVNSLNLKDSTVESGSPQFFNETPVINLSGGNITLDNTSLSQYCHYDSPQMHGEIYVKNPSTLNGYKTTKIRATGSFKLLNKSRIYMNIGQVVVDAEDISVENSEILSRNVRGPASGWVGRIKMNAQSAINFTGAKLNSETISSGVRAEISLIGNSLNADNSEVRIFDEQKGKAGKIQLNFNESIKMDNSQILSVGSSHLTRDINGNDIIVKSKDLTMKDSLINGMVEGDGKEGKTQLHISDELSLEDSFVGGLGEPLKLVENEALITDGSLGEVKNLGVGTEIDIPSDLGEIHGENLFHSFEALNVGSGQTALLIVPEGVKNVFLRITGEQETKLNGVIQADQPNRNITLINKNGFELGPDVDVDQFSGIRLGAVDQLSFKDGSVFGVHGGDTESLSGAAADFNIQTDQLTGAVKLMGAALKGSEISEVGDAEISIYGDKIELLSSGISSANGADINLIGNKVDVRQAAVLHAISPAKGEGGNINIKSRELNMKGAGIRTSSVDGQAGDVNIDVDKADVYISSIESNNYIGKNSRAKFKTGDINLIARESLDAYRPLVALRSNTTGGTGNLSANVGSLTLDGLGLFATEIWVMAYQGNTGNLDINADSIDARLVRFINAAMEDRGKLAPAEMEMYGDVTINANEMNVHTAEIHTGTKRSEKNSTLGDITIDVENDLILNKLKIANYNSTARGMGGDITLSAKNILNGMDPEKVDPTDYPSITGTGSLSFLAEENLELGRMKLEGINTAPSRDLLTQFKGNNISLGMDLGDDAAGVENVGIVYHGDRTGVQRVSIQGEGDVRFVSGINLYAPELTLEAGSLDINDSEITLNGAYESGFKVRDEMTLRGASTIHSLSPTGEKNSKDGGAKTLNITSGQLTLEAKSEIWTRNAAGKSSDNKPIANLKIQSGLISLDEAQVGSFTLNQSKAGDVEIEADDLSLRDSFIGSVNFTQANAGDVTINTGHIVLADKSFIANGLNKALLDWGWDPFAPGDAGDISITSDSLRLENGSFIRNAQIDTSLPGNVSVTSGEINLADGSYIATESVPLYQSDFSNRTEVDQNGSVNIKTGSLDLSDSSYVKTTTVIPKRNAGDITVEADSVSLTGRSSMLSNTEPNKFEAELGLTGLDYGNAGRLEISSHTVQLSDQSKISSDSFTSGDGGDVNITATTGLGLANRSAIYAGALGQGQGGRIAIDTTALNLSGKSAVVADVRDSGNGGEVTVKATSLEMDESLIYGSTSGAGAGSSISVEAESVALQNGARIESAASAAGAAGALDVRSGTVTIRGIGEGFDPKDIEGGETGEEVASGLLTSTVGSGNAGTIELNADHLEMQQGLIGSASSGTGAAGSVGLRLAKGLSLGQGASVSVSSSQADGGDIEIETAGEVSLAKSELTASAAKDGGSIRLLGAGNRSIRESLLSAEAGQNGGNITISKPGLLFMNRGQLTANAVKGDGGYISVVANTFLPSLDSLITASSEYGAQGVVEIDSVETDIGGGLVILPDELKDRKVNLAERCALQLQGNVSSFFINGQGGLPVWSKESYIPSLLETEQK